MDSLLPTDLAAIRARVSISTLYRYIELGILPVAGRGPRRQIYLDPVEVDRWVLWFDVHQEQVKRKRGQRISALARVKGMVAAGKLLCEEKDESDRNRLFAAVKAGDQETVKEALRELYRKYSLRLPLVENRLGISLERQR